MSRRTNLKLTNELDRQLERESNIVANSPDDDPPMSVVIDAALAHLVESKENIQKGLIVITANSFRNGVKKRWFSGPQQRYGSARR